jgi:hypothetical protein
MGDSHRATFARHETTFGRSNTLPPHTPTPLGVRGHATTTCYN